MNRRFFALLGIECSGKSTQLRRIGARLRAEGHDVVLAREPGSTALGNCLRKILKDPSYADLLDPPTRLRLFSIARRAFLNEVVRSAADTSVVVVDRYYPCTVAYQAYGEGLDRELVDDLCRRVVSELLPSRMFYLDISVEEMLRRLKCRTHPDDYYDALDAAFHERVRAGYIQQVEESGGLILRIDGMRPPSQITAEILAAIHRDMNVATPNGE